MITKVKSTAIFLIVYVVYTSCVYLELWEGKKCQWDGANGTCISVFKCLKAYDDIRKKTPPPICAFKDKEPLVCCTDCNPLTDKDARNHIFNREIGSLWSSDSKSHKKYNEYLDKLDFPCKSHRNSTRVWWIDDKRQCHFGSEYDDGKFNFNAEDNYPRKIDLLHTVLLGYGKELESARWLCGGSIISESYILTAANCSSSPDQVPVHHVVTGKLNDTGLSEPWRRYGVKRVIPHPQYRSHSKYHDIALIETDTPILFSDQVLPISLHLQSQYPFDVKNVAWSVYPPGTLLIDILDSVFSTSLVRDLSVINWRNRTCERLYPPQPLMSKGYNDTIQVCYGWLTETNYCEADMGSSVFEYDLTRCGSELIGVMSVGRECGLRAGSVLLTRVSYYVPWIESIVWP